MAMMNWFFVALAALALAVVLSLIYRSSVAMNDEDRPFLDSEQEEGEGAGWRPATRVVVTGSGGLALAMLGVVIYEIAAAF